MKNLCIAFLVVLNTLAATGQTSQNRSVGSFSGVKVAEGVDVYLKKGDKESIRVEVTGTDVNNVITEISGSYLKVHMKDDKYRNNFDAKVYVTYVKIDKLSASSAGSIFSEETIKASTLEVGASSAGSIDISVEADQLTASSSSAGEVELKGKAKALVVDANSAGEVDADDLQAQRVSAEANSAGSIKINVVDDLNAHANSGGSIRYKGNPNKSITTSNSGGSVKKSN
jgi:hypothetical protein